MSDLPSIQTILTYWKDHQAELYDKTGYLLDSGEPTCWACEDTFNGRFDIGPTRAARWEKSPLQRCHIVPRSLGGSADPSNFVLMCPTCHDRSPDTNSPEIVFAWMRAQSKFKRQFESINQALVDFGVDLTNLNEDRASEIIKAAGSAEFRTWSKDKVGFHFKQTSEPGGQLSVSSFVGLLLEFMKRDG